MQLVNIIPRLNRISHCFIRASHRWNLAFLFLAACLVPANTALASIFPPQPSARKFINFDGRGFIINGKRIFLASGSLHYERVPRALWKNRLLKMKRDGFNCIQTYIFWSYQEPRKGQFNFHGRRNLAAFLHLVKQTGCYAIVRVGPYCNGEWNSGGLPVWLKFIPDLAIRQGDPRFLHAVGRYFDKLLPIVAANEITHGGPVIMVQLENEDSAGWGAVLPNRYYRYLYHKALSEGIDVPIFFSGQHHGASPAGVGPWISQYRTSPWYTTEMWSGWFTNYRHRSPGQHTLTYQAPWHVIGYGGNGYDIYMAVGGTTPSHFYDNVNKASYDFAAPIGQAGDLRPLYYHYKLINYFARTFQRILETSINIRVNTPGLPEGLRMFTRVSPHGRIDFFQNLTSQAITCTPPDGCPMVIPPQHLFPMVSKFSLNHYFILRHGCARILRIVHQGVVTSIVTYGPPNSPILLRFDQRSAGTVTASPGFIEEGLFTHQYSLHTDIPAHGIDIYTLRVHQRTLRIFVVRRGLARRTWFLHDAGKRVIIFGPHYAGTLLQHKTILCLQTVDLLHAPVRKAELFGPSNTPLVFTAPPAVSTRLHQTAPTLGPWQMRLADTPARASFNADQWLAVTSPLPMGADDYPGSYEWYRTQVTVPTPGAYELKLDKVKDWGEVFANGQLQTDVTGRIADLTLQAGHNTLAILTICDGRRKHWMYSGPFAAIAQKGLWGPVRLMHFISTFEPVRLGGITGWSYCRLNSSNIAAMMRVMEDRCGVRKLQPLPKTPGLIPAGKGPLWFRVALPAINADHLVLHWKNLPRGSMVVFNSARLAIIHTKTQSASRPAQFWHRHSCNVLSVLIPTGGNPLKAFPLLGFEHYQYQAAVKDEGLVTGWRMHGGRVDTGSSWHPYTHAPDAPCYYRTTFIFPGYGNGDHPVLRAAWGYCGGGYMWLNGHNLGRYRDPVMPQGLYLPSCWLKSGVNTLTVFDESGKSPQRVRLVLERAAARRKVVLHCAVPE
ncbi:MAG: beta-galactosidase [Phycisphaerae bacterium]